MVSEVLFVNVFLVPIIALMIENKSKKVIPTWSMAYLEKYALNVIVNVFFSKAVVKLIKILFGEEFLMDSGEYMFIAIVIALLTPFVFELIKKNIRVKVSVVVSEEDEVNGKKKINL